MLDLFKTIFWNIQGPESVEVRPGVLNDYLKIYNSVGLFLHIDLIVL